VPRVDVGSVGIAPIFDRRPDRRARPARSSDSRKSTCRPGRWDVEASASPHRRRDQSPSMCRSVVTSRIAPPMRRRLPSACRAASVSVSTSARCPMAWSGRAIPSAGRSRRLSEASRVEVGTRSRARHPVRPSPRLHSGHPRRWGLIHPVGRAPSERSERHVYPGRVWGVTSGWEHPHLGPVITYYVLCT